MIRVAYFVGLGMGFILGLAAGVLLATTHLSAAHALPIAYNSTGWPCAADLLDRQHIRWTCLIEQ
jgi:hypothetical protein